MYYFSVIDYPFLFESFKINTFLLTCRQALQLRKNDPDFHVAPVILDIINTIEGGPPVDVSAVRSM